MSAISEKLSPWLFTIGIFVFWELVCRLFKIDRFILPTPLEAFQAMATYWQPLLRHSLVTRDLPRALSRDDRIQLHPKGRGRADPDHVVRHRRGAGDPDRVPDLVLPDRGQRRDRTRDHGA